ncbi:unnamed protein product [Rotaria sp. Silwood1]|nr:unnamed protein product [Rotaria sp. Silwood1]CAF3825423.1 unnamed protein product [Rotaria sp. Silwood1]CAF3899784.1 unnamed protein product [Rotaria sp. Silwood1]CAF4664478.1 unnamed protein product [Rotaria sp. Silwood1]
MWLTIILYTLFLYIIYHLIKFWIIYPWRIQRDFFNQGIPGRYMPIVGDILRYRQAYLADKPFSCVEEANAEFGDYYHTSFGPFPCLNTSDPALIEGVLKTNYRFYHKSELSRAIASTVLGYENIVLAEDENHTRHRRLVSPIFQHQNINSMTSLIVDTISSFLTKWQIKTYDKNYPLILDVSKEMSNLTLNILIGCVFGAEIMEDLNIHETIYQCVKIASTEIENRIYNMIIMIPILNQLPLFGKRRIDKCRHVIKNIVLQMINQRKQGLTRATCKGPNLLDLLLAAHGDDRKQKFTDEEVSDEAITQMPLQKVGAGRYRYLNDNEENHLVSLFQILPNYGFSLTAGVAINISSEYMKSLGLSFKPGRKWLQAFVKRHRMKIKWKKEEKLE